MLFRLRIFSFVATFLDPYFPNFNLSLGKLPKTLIGKKYNRAVFPVLRVLKLDAPFSRPKTFKCAPHIFYFECYYQENGIGTPHAETIAVIGLFDETAVNNDKVLPGWCDQKDETNISMGFHSDDGSIRNMENLFQRNEKYVSKPGDIMGVGIDFELDLVFWTKNGQLIGNT
jgi:hypothetical protein